MQVVTAKELRRKRTRAKIFGTAERPRLSASVTNKHVTAQLIDDQAGQTLAFVTTIKTDTKGKTMTALASWAGEQIAAAAKDKKIDTVVFDRGSKIYHGRLKALADAAREKGLKI
jgi:large subunit ribosomal protein L18